MRFGYSVSFEALYKGAIEILGPYGIPYTFRRLAKRISQLQSGSVCPTYLAPLGHVQRGATSHLQQGNFAGNPPRVRSDGSRVARPGDRVVPFPDARATLRRRAVARRLQEEMPARSRTPHSPAKT
jgi:hypothetical protein